MRLFLPTQQHAYLHGLAQHKAYQFFAFGLIFNFLEYLMAEEVGFEPTVRFPARQFSRLEPSTTRPPFLSSG